METWKRPLASVGRRRAAWLADRTGRELRVARLMVGRTQAEVAALAGISQSALSRLELGTQPVDLVKACRVAAAVGCDIGMRVYPDAGVNLRDRGQLSMAQAFLALVQRGVPASLEVPVGADERDRRAVDLVLDLRVELVAVEFERWLVDFQAQHRAHQVKRDALAARMNRPVRLLLVVRDTVRNRSTLSTHADLMARAGLLEPRAVWRALRFGQPLGSDGIAWLRERNARWSVPTG